MQVKGIVGMSLFYYSALLFPKPKHRDFSADAKPEGTVLTQSFGRDMLQ